MAKARLENWRVYGNQLHGFIYDDSEGRCDDGTEALTSPPITNGTTSK